MRKKKTILLLIATLLLINAANIYLRFAPQKAPQACRFVMPQVTRVFDAISLKGVLAEQGRESYFSPGPCVITQVYVGIGDTVSAGQVLMELAKSESQQIGQEAVYSDMEKLLEVFSQLGVPQINNGQGRALSAEYLVEKASLNKDEQTYYIISTIDGTVMDLNASGSITSGIIPCAVVSDMNKLALVAEVGESAAHLVHPGMECSITVTALGTAGFGGRIETIMPYARQTGLLAQSQEIKTQVVVALESPPQGLRPGYSAVAKAAVNIADNVLTLPYEAIGQDDENREYVMVFSGGFCQKRLIITGREMSDCCEIKAGLGPEDIVLLDTDGLKHGEKVDLVYGNN